MHTIHIHLTVSSHKHLVTLLVRCWNSWYLHGDEWSIDVDCVSSVDCTHSCTVYQTVCAHCVTLHTQETNQIKWFQAGKQTLKNKYSWSCEVINDGLIYRNVERGISENTLCSYYGETSIRMAGGRSKFPEDTSYQFHVNGAGAGH